MCWIEVLQRFGRKSYYWFLGCGFKGFSKVDITHLKANAWQYSLFVPQDIEGHIALMGGKENYSNHLDQMFSANSSTSGREQVDITGLIGQYAHGNEPTHRMLMSIAIL